MTEQLKPCPFCGGEATITEYASGHKGNGTFTADYKAGCDKCKIHFCHNSEFCLVDGQPRVTVNGYKLAVEAWNRRTGKQHE